MSLTNKPYFCALPWMHLHISTVGKVVPCCVARNEKKFPHISEGEFPILFNSKPMNELRRNMLNDIPSPECEQCYSLEKYGSHSTRVHSNKKYLTTELSEKILSNTNLDGSLKEIDILYWDVRFSNVCNYKCRMCGADYSTKWYEDADLISIYPITNKNLVSIENVTDFCNKNKDYLKNIEYVYFAGGEPLVQQQHYEFLIWCIENNLKPELYYQSNGSILKYGKFNIFDIWKNFSKVTYSVSIDGFGKMGEYIRSGFDNETVDKNLNSVCVEFGSNREITVNTTCMIYNAFFITEFFDDISKKDWVLNSNVYLQLLVYPEFLQPKVLPRELKLKAIEKIENSIWFKMYPNKFEALLTNLKEESTPDLWRRFKHHTEKLDERRKESILGFFPELGQYFND